MNILYHYHISRFFNVLRHGIKSSSVQEKNNLKNVQNLDVVFTFAFNIISTIQITRFKKWYKNRLQGTLAHNRDSVETDPLIEDVVTEVRPIPQWNCVFGDGMCLLKEVYRK